MVWNKGIKLTPEMKVKMNMSGLELGRGWMRGKHHSQKTKDKIKETQLKNGHTPPKEFMVKGVNLGKKHWNWKGGVSRPYKDGYYSPEYKEWRRLVFERDNYTCLQCGRSGDKVYLTAHHIKSFSKYPAMRFDLENGITLCENCHSKTDNYKGRANKKEKMSWHYVH